MRGNGAVLIGAPRRRFVGLGSSTEILFSPYISIFEACMLWLMVWSIVLDPFAHPHLPCDAFHHQGFLVCRLARGVSCEE